MTEIELDAPLKGMTELTLLSTEARLRGRQRNTPDEMLWGMSRAMHVARLRNAEAYQHVYGRPLVKE
ncbi:MAG: hypothetical protein HC853_06600 [Anaerolineae bacterium]|nr:hypothetical protein [Anaerolineae bacterium]